MFVFVVSFTVNMLLYRFAAAEGVRMIDMTGGAFLVAGIATAFFIRRPKRQLVRNELGSALAALAVVIIVGGVAAFWTMAEGIRISGAARGGLFFMTVPVVTAAIEAFLGTRFSRGVIANGALIILGGLLLASPGLLGAGSPRGDLLLVITALSFASANVAAATVTAAWTPVTVAAFRALGGGIGLALVGANPLMGGRWAIASGLLAAVFLPAIYTLIERIGPARASLANVYSSLLAAFLGVALLGESLTAIQAAGGVIIIAGSLVQIRARLATDRSPPGSASTHAAGSRVRAG